MKEVIITLRYFFEAEYLITDHDGSVRKFFLEEK